MNRPARTCLLLCALGVLFASFPARADNVVSDTVTLSFAEAGGITWLGVTHVAVALEASENVSASVPGAAPQIEVVEDSATAGRFRYTVHGQGGSMKITVRALTSINQGALAVSAASAGGGGGGDVGTPVGGEVAVGAAPADLITGIGDCYTGTGASEGPLLTYTLQADPGFSIGTVSLQFELTAGP